MHHGVAYHPIAKAGHSAIHGARAARSSPTLRGAAAAGARDRPREICDVHIPRRRVAAPPRGATWIVRGVALDRDATRAGRLRASRNARPGEMRYLDGHDFRMVSPDSNLRQAQLSCCKEDPFRGRAGGSRRVAAAAAARGGRGGGAGAGVAAAPRARDRPRTNVDQPAARAVGLSASRARDGTTTNRRCDVDQPAARAAGLSAVRGSEGVGIVRRERGGLASRGAGSSGGPRREGRDRPRNGPRREGPRRPRTKASQVRPSAELHVRAGARGAPRVGVPLSGGAREVSVSRGGAGRRRSRRLLPALRLDRRLGRPGGARGRRSARARARAGDAPRHGARALRGIFTSRGGARLDGPGDVLQRPSGAPGAPTRRRGRRAPVRAPGAPAPAGRGGGVDVFASVSAGFLRRSTAGAALVPRRGTSEPER